MSASGRRSAAQGAQRVGAASTRAIRAWRTLPSERRLAAAAAFALFVTLFLPWYQETVIASGVNSLRSVSESLTGWAAFSFVEAAVLLVAASVLALLFMRAEGRAFHVPGGDGGVITAAGFWTCVLIIWRMFDKEGTTGHGQYATTSGIEWGIFIALGVAGLLTYAGSRIRHAHEPEPPLPGDPGPRPDGAGGGRARRMRSRSPAEAPARPPADEAPTRADRPEAWEPTSHPQAREQASHPVRAPAPPPEGRPGRVRPRSVAAGLDSVTEPAEPATVPLPPSEAPTSRRRRAHRGTSGAEVPGDPRDLGDAAGATGATGVPDPEDRLTTRLDEPD
ncbi:MAG TPA: hypothetical protein VG325_01415 [Solirubrobacteraceae bacterium]|nr:hypothetical protein [Solirubrobacteraceae bacterium]